MCDLCIDSVLNAVRPALAREINQRHPHPVPAGIQRVDVTPRRPTTQPGAPPVLPARPTVRGTLTGIEVFCPRASDGATALVSALVALGLPARKVRQHANLRPNSLVINWGAELGLLANNRNGQVALNNHVLHNKLAELQKLRNAGIAVPTVAQHRPQGWRHNGDGSGWLGRRYSHQSGNDLRNRHVVPQFWVGQLNIQHEFRVHVFKGASIRMGKKVPRAGERNVHPWIRSVETGWIIDYSTGWHGQRFSGVSRTAIREAAKRAVDALGYDFGAVDIGVDHNGGIYVFEVNSAPALTNAGTASDYARAVQGVFRGA